MKIRQIVFAVIIVILASALSGAGQQNAEQLFKTGLYEEEVGGDLQKAIGIYQDLLKRFPANREAAAKAQLHIGLCYEKLGTTEAEKAFQKVVDNYPEQSDAVREARGKLSLLARSRAAAKTGASEFRTRRVWSGPEVEIEGAVSPDGRFLTFVDMENGDLAMRDLAAGTNRRLTHIDEKQSWSEFAMFSKWSRDGQRIAYQWYCTDDILELRVLDLSDSSVRTIHRNKSPYDWAQAFDWSPDGRRVLAAIFLEATPTQGRETRAGLISIEDGSFKRIEGHYETLLASFSLPQGFAFSPDGQFIVYDAPRSDEETGNREIFIIELANGRESVLVEHPGYEEVVAWTPDGRGLLFTSDRTGTHDLYLLPLSNGRPQEAPRLIKSGVGTIAPLGFTPRGDFYYGQGGSERDLYAVGVDPATGKLQGPAKKLALPHQGRNFGPSYSPDGKLLAYLSAPGGRGQAISIYSPETGRVRELNPKLSGNLFPQWIPPDGRALSVMASDKEGRRILYRVDPQTGEATPIGPLADSGFSFRNPPVWTTDGKRLFYTGGLRSDEKRYIYTYDLETGKSERLLGTPDDACFITISPDGKWLAFINEHGKKVLRIIPTSGGEPREVHSYEHGDHLLSPAWSADGRSIYLPKLSDPKGNFWDLYRISLDGREVEKTEAGLLWIRSLSASPDGRSLAFESSGKSLGEREVWVMENFLPPATAVPKKADKEFSMRRVYDGTGLEWGNALSSDGRYLVYTNWDSGDLAVMDLVTKKSRPLTTGGGLAAKTGEMGETSAFSPDNTKIAYGWYNKDKVPELWIINADGSGQRLLWRDEKSAWIRPHEWSPDGRQILAITMKKEGQSQIVLISAVDGAVRVLRDASEKDPELDMSPDGRFVTCSMATGPVSRERDIFIIKTADGGMNPLVAHAGDDYTLGWAPDGRTLVFSSNRTGAYGLWGIKVSEGMAQAPPFAIKPTFNYAEPVRLAPDGSLYYVLTESIMDIYTANVDPVTGKVQGQPKTVPVRYTGANAMAVWSPDGTRLAYLTSPGGFSGTSWPAVFSIVDIGTGEERQVKSKIEAIIPSHGLGWAPDGRSILVIGRTGEETAVYKVDVKTGASDPLIIIPKFEYVLSAAWSADGKSIFYPQGNPTRILRRDLDTGKDVELVSIPGPAGMPAVSVSPDGKWLAFTTKPEGEDRVRLKILPSGGGEVRELVMTAPRGLIIDLNWTPDGRYIWFRQVTPSEDPKAGSKFESWRISPEGGEPQQLELEVKGGGIRLNPDGRQIVYYSGRGRRDLWVMENFLQTENAKK